METNIQKFELSQNGKNYILTTEVIGEYVKLTCVETGISNPAVYFGEFTLSYLKQLSKIFKSISTIYEAQEILNQNIQTQKVTVEHKGNIINIILYLTRETESEDSYTLKMAGNNGLGEQAVAYTQPVEYKTEENVTNTVYTQEQTLTDTNLNISPVETTTTTQEVYTTSNENHQNYDNYENYNYQNYDNTNLNVDTVNTETQVETNIYNTTVTPEVQIVTLPLSYETTNVEYQTQVENQDLNQYYDANAYQYQTETQTETTQQYVTQENNQVPYTIEQPREQIQYTVPNQEFTYSTVETNTTPDVYQQQKIVETTTTTTTQQYNPVQPTPAPTVDMTLYNQKISQLQTETNQIKGEYEVLKNEANTLSGEVGQLRGQISVLLEENRVLRQKNGSMPNESQIHEISFLKQENERLKKQLEQYITLQTTFEQYKRLKEEEINYFKLQIQEYIKNIKKLEEILSLKQKEIDELKNQIQQLIKNVNISQSQNIIMRQQQKMDSGSVNKQMLTIQDTRMEIIKGDIIQSTAELEFLTRKICQNFQKVTLDLLYKATLDTDKASAFHNKCDFANRTLVLVKSGNGRRFGGYTTCNWKGNSIEKKDEEAFVFSLDKMQIYDIIPGEDAIGCYPKYGPVFLGCQIRIYDEFFTNGGSTFEKGLNYNTQEDYELTGGMKQFEVKEIEVYGIELE